MPESSPTRFAQEEEESEREISPSPPTGPVAKKVFEDQEGTPILFFLHRSIDNWSRNNLSKTIESHGGVVQRDGSNVDTVLVDPKRCSIEAVQLTYNVASDRSKRDAWVEPMSFVKRCIGEGSVRHRMPNPKGMGGSVRAYRHWDREAFTEEDDDNLARHIALRIPDATNGGRRGDGLYRELDMAYDEDPVEFAWVKRHTWQSWRNRFNKNMERFEPMIDRHVASEDPSWKQQYPLQRKHKRRDWSEDERDHGSSIKRQRVEFSQGPSDRRTHSPTGKGKEKAVAEEEFEYVRHSPDSVYVQPEEMEPRPSPTLRRAPIRTYAGRRSHQARASSPPKNQEPQTSQATLVEPGSQRHEPMSSGKARGGGLQSRERSEPQDVNPTPEIFEPLDDVLQEPASDRHTVVATISPAGVAGSIKKRVLAAASGRPVAIKVARRPRTQPPLPAAVPLEPFYRRSRSRSVEHSAFPLQPNPRRKKGTVPEDRRPAMPQLADSANEHDRHDEGLMEQGSLSVGLGLGESLRDEQDVERLLVSTIIERSQEASEDAAASDGQNYEVRDSDDAQTDRWLRRFPAQGAWALPVEFDIDPQEMLRRFHDRSTPTSSSLSARPVPALRPGNDHPMRPRHSVPGSSLNVFDGVTPTSQQLRTPAVNQRRLSTSSRESFPIAGTKASAAKKVLETDQKHTPYRPPAGTRAARLMGAPGA
ncbi:hypothetical protein C0991_002404 [Blastosporella zonata]|nr:hypothetical protein C0991_002404 [Blastosporella zonata]